MEDFFDDGAGDGDSDSDSEQPGATPATEIIGGSVGRTVRRTRRKAHQRPVVGATLLVRDGRHLARQVWLARLPHHFAHAQGSDQVRQAFSKRKRGLVLKAYQLYKLTDAKVSSIAASAAARELLAAFACGFASSSLKHMRAACVV